MVCSVSGFIHLFKKSQERFQRNLQNVYVK